MAGHLERYASFGTPCKLLSLPLVKEDVAEQLDALWRPIKQTIEREQRTDPMLRFLSAMTPKAANCISDERRRCATRLHSKPSTLKLVGLGVSQDGSY
jgi:hypothetical protein